MRPPFPNPLQSLTPRDVDGARYYFKNRDLTPVMSNPHWFYTYGF